MYIGSPWSSDTTFLNAEFLHGIAWPWKGPFNTHKHLRRVSIATEDSSKLYRQVVGIPMGTNCAPLVADLFLFCYERDFMMSLSDDKQTDIIDSFNTTSRYWTIF